MVRNIIALIVISLVLCDASNIPKVSPDQISGLLTGSSFDVREGFDFQIDTPHENYTCPHDYLACPGQLQPQNKYKTRIWACVPTQEIERISLTHQQFDSEVKGIGFQRFSTKCNKVKTIDEEVFKVAIRFNTGRGHVWKDDVEKFPFDDYCVAFKSNKDYRVFRIYDGSEKKVEQIENIDKIKFPTGDDLKFTANISYKSIVCGKGNDIQLAINGTQNKKFSTISKNQTTVVTTLPLIVSPIITSKTFWPGKSTTYPMKSLTCPNNFALCKRNQSQNQKCVHEFQVYEFDGRCQITEYSIDEMLFRFLPALNKLIDEEEIKQNRIKREYIVMVMQHKDEGNSTAYYEVPKLDFEVSEVMKRDAVLKMKTKNEPIEVNYLMKIINIEFVPRKGPTWIDRNCGKVSILLFFLILFLRHYVYEKIVRIKSDNGDDDKIEDDESEHVKNNGDENDDEENNNNEIRKRDEGIKNDEKTEIFVSEV